MIIETPADEMMRLLRARALLAKRAKRMGPDALFVFTGNAGDMLCTSRDEATNCDEWLTPALLGDDIRVAALKFLGGENARTPTAFVVLARSSGAIAAWCWVTARRGVIVSVAPEGGSCHPSVHIAATISGARVVSCTVDELSTSLRAMSGEISVIVTTVTSTQEKLADQDIEAVVGECHSQNVPVMLDDAYGAVVRPALYDGPKSLEFGADVVTGNGDKGGLGGPRCALVAGREDLILKMSAFAASVGLDARAPTLVGVSRALRQFDPGRVRQQAADGVSLGEALIRRFPDRHVSMSALGASLSGKDLSELIGHGRRLEGQIGALDASAAVGLCLLRDAGIVTVNALGQPGASTALRLKPVASALQDAGGAERVADSVVSGIGRAADACDDVRSLRELLQGTG